MSLKGERVKWWQSGKGRKRERGQVGKFKEWQEKTEKGGNVDGGNGGRVARTKVVRVEGQGVSRREGATS